MNWKSNGPILVTDSFCLNHRIGFATSKAHPTCMIADLSHALAHRNLMWKCSSLHLVACGALSHDTKSLDLTIGEHDYVWVATSKFDALGACIDSKSSSSVL